MVFWFLTLSLLPCLSRSDISKQASELLSLMEPREVRVSSMLSQQICRYSAHLGTSLESVTSRPSKMGSNLALLIDAILHHLAPGWILSPHNEENETISSSIIRNINVTSFFGTNAFYSRKYPNIFIPPIQHNLCIWRSFQVILRQGFKVTWRSVIEVWKVMLREKRIKILFWMATK